MTDTTQTDPKTINPSDMNAEEFRAREIAHMEGEARKGVIHGLTKAAGTARPIFDFVSPLAVGIVRFGMDAPAEKLRTITGLEST